LADDDDDETELEFALVGEDDEAETSLDD